MRVIYNSNINFLDHREADGKDIRQQYKLPMSMIGSSGKHLYSIISVVFKLKGLVEISILVSLRLTFYLFKIKNISKLSLSQSREGSPFKILLGK